MRFKTTPGSYTIAKSLTPYQRNCVVKKINKAKPGKPAVRTEAQEDRHRKAVALKRRRREEVQREAKLAKRQARAASRAAADAADPKGKRRADDDEDVDEEVDLNLGLDVEDPLLSDDEEDEEDEEDELEGDDGEDVPAQR